VPAGVNTTNAADPAVMIASSAATMRKTRFMR
jgi:hypothetical protein